jgi:hypothetical protein
MRFKPFEKQMIDLAGAEGQKELDYRKEGQ